MAVVRVVEFLSSNLVDQFGATSSIEIDDKGFESGGFGEVFHCRALNGQPLVIRQAAKIFTASDDPGYLTVRKLQMKLRDPAYGARTRVGALPGLQALPQLSFRGLRNGRPVIGYLSNYLEPSRFMAFDSFFEHPQAAALRDRYALSVPIGYKLRLGRQLAGSIAFLRDIGYIHADINAQNMFVDTATPSLALIDFDSGAVTDDVASMPTTWGKPNEWLAPEILDQLWRHSDSRIDLFTDTWSVAVGIYYLLFLWSPYCFLEQLSITDLESYFRRNHWPDIPTQNVSVSAVAAHGHIVALLEKQPYLQTIYQRFQQTFNSGALHPSERTPYYQWVETLRAAEASVGATVASVAVVPRTVTVAPVSQGGGGARPRVTAVAQRGAMPQLPGIAALAPPPMAQAPTPVGLRPVRSSSPSLGTVAAAVVLLGFLVWLIPRAFRPQADGERDVSARASQQAAEQAAEQARRAEANRLAERTRVENGIVGTWSFAPLARLTIKREGNRFRAEIPVQVANFGSAVTVLQHFDGSILPDNQIRLDNDNRGKLVNPAIYYNGPFSSQAWIDLSPDGAFLSVRFTEARAGSPIVMRRALEEPGFGGSVAGGGEAGARRGAESEQAMSQTPLQGAVSPTRDTEVFSTSRTEATGPLDGAPKPSAMVDAGVYPVFAPGRYVRNGQGSDYVDLNSDGTLFMQRNGITARGMYRVQGDTIVMQRSNGVAGIGRFSGNTVTDPDGIVWERQAESGRGPASASAALALRHREPATRARPQATHAVPPATRTPRLRSPERW
jgi:serine/threonine protein kinase